MERDAEISIVGIVTNLLFSYSTKFSIVANRDMKKIVIDDTPNVIKNFKEIFLELGSNRKGFICLNPYVELLKSHKGRDMG